MEKEIEDGLLAIRKKLKIEAARLFLVEELLNDPEETAFRKKKCKGDKLLGLPKCSLYVRRKDECNWCGCVIDLKSLTLTNKDSDFGTLAERATGGKIIKTHCPMGKWGDKETANYYRELKGEELLK